MAYESFLACIFFLIVGQLLSSFTLVTDGAKVPAVIVFGDSTVDAGNNNQIPTIARSNFEPYGQDFDVGGNKPTGRFCNGRLYTDIISDSLGVKSAIPAYLDPDFGIEDFATGVTFGSAGTGYDNATSDILNVIPIWRQLEYFAEYKSRLTNFLGHQKAAKLLREALYIVSSGTNDFIENYFILPTRPSQFNVDEYIAFLLNIADNMVSELYGLGARKISIVGIPVCGCIPIARTLSNDSEISCKEDWNNACRDFNWKLQVSIANLNRQLRGIELVYSDFYHIVLSAIQNPWLHGLENVTTGCCGTGAYELSYLCNKYQAHLCPNSDKYLFWDSVHSTEKMNKILADYLLKTSLMKLMRYS